MIGRLALFAGGAAVACVVIASPFAQSDRHSLTAHMIQHLLLMNAAAPLILLSRPRFVSPLAARAASHPVFCWFAATLVLVGWHVPAMFSIALRSEFWHAVEMASFLAAGLLFWSVVIPAYHEIAPSPRWHVVLYLFFATLPCDALSAYLAFCGRVVYPAYLCTPRPSALSPLDDQEMAGALMWVVVTIAYLLPAVVVTTRNLSDQPRLHSQADVL